MNRENKLRLTKKLDVFWDESEVTRKMIELGIEVPTDALKVPREGFGLAFHGFHRGGVIGMVCIVLVPGCKHVRHLMMLPEECGEDAKDYFEDMMKYFVQRAAEFSGARPEREFETWLKPRNFSQN